MPERIASAGPKAQNWRSLGSGLLGTRAGLIALSAMAGCGIGTDARLQGERDASADRPVDARADVAAAEPDASTWSAVPEGIPPIDREHHRETALATFAMG